MNVPRGTIRGETFMDFIGTGNRILTENFVIGYLYTITFKTGIYINSACIGKGADFVMFQRAEPDLLFTLNMTTASDVYTIELYSSGGGTDDYEALNNKPKINNVTLSGNKSSSELGLQSTIPDLDTIRAGAAAGATAVQPAALSDYQPVISDLDTIRAGAAAGATAVQPAALSDYQSKIDSTHMLSADYVDDTSTTHKFATQTQLDQIELNKNNILLITPFDTAPTQNSAKGMTSGALFTEFGKTLRKQSTLSTNDDFDTATSIGMYKFNGGPANNPAVSTGAYGILLVFTFDNYIMQLCYDFVNGVYYRNKVSSWSAWTKFN